MSYRLVRPAASAATAVRPDPEQLRVIGHTDDPLLVIGGPGTGKTATLVESVAARVAEGVPPERILVLTFGRRGADALRTRIERRIAEPGRATAEVLVRTFHAYAFGLLRTAAAELGDPAPRLLTGPEQDLVIRELLTDDEVVWPAGLAPALRTKAFAGQLRDLLLRCAERGIGPHDLAKYGEELGRPEWLAAAGFLREYEQVLALRDATGRAGAAYDNAELIRTAAALLADDPELLAAQRRRLSFVYVDELADTDPAQLDLLAQVAGGGAHLVAFADPDSSTYAFRGADPGGVTSFPDRFRAADGREAHRVILTRSYRAGPGLLAATHRVAARLRGPSRHRALTPSTLDSPLSTDAVEVHTFRSATSEAAYVAHRLREAHLLEDVPWSRMAVVVRSTTLALPRLRRALTQAGVPVLTLAEDLPLHVQPGIAPLLLALRCVTDPDRLDEAAAVALLHSPLGGADPLAERRLRQGLRALALAAGDRRPSGVLLVEALRDPTELAAVERRWAAPARRVAGLLQVIRDAAARPGVPASGSAGPAGGSPGAARVSAGAAGGSSGAAGVSTGVAGGSAGPASVEDTLWALWHASGLAERWAATSSRGGHRGEAADRDLDAAMVLFDAAARFADRLPGAGTGAFLDFVEGQQLPADTLAPHGDRGAAVRVLTAHAAKGLEWDVVVVAGVQEGIWPDLRLRGSVLGSEQLVDAVAGRIPTQRGASALVTAVGQTAALLDEERRLFYVAATRARHRLIVTAVASGDGEEQPSRFLDELSGSREAADDAGDREPTTTRLPRALTLPALVAELRLAVADPTCTPRRRAVAAAELARLSAAGVTGADPDQWWGLRELSDGRPLVDEGAQVTVTPSTVEGVQRCSLRWLLERHGGAAQRTPEQSVGNLVHEVAMDATGAEVDRAALLSYLAAEFDKIELTARWMADRERRRAEDMIDKLVRWLSGNPRRVAAIEADFLAQLDSVVRIKGRVDRLEIDDQGRLVVIDLKTGKTTSVSDADLAEQPQLGAYQAAVSAGAFPELGTEPGGAALVQLGTSHVEAKEQRQPSLAQSPDPEWAAAMVRRTAATMAASTFHAVANSKCRSCPVRTACPISGKGRQVTDSTGSTDPGDPS